MKQQWQDYSDKYLQLSPREQVLIALTGLVAIIFITFYFFIDSYVIDNQRLTKSISQVQTQNKTLALSIKEYKQALLQDPNIGVRNKITQFEKKLAKVDTKLLSLTSELINPIQMRYALLELLKVEKSVSLLSFELIGAEPLLTQEQLTQATNDEPKTSQLSSNEKSQVTSVNLYRHGIKIKLSGDYFALQNYLRQLEKLSWKFFWQDFDFKVKEYPLNELSIEIYSLGSKREFIGV
jgi:MSHA biogenesis protein MshJ